jgi:hypothetical protein
MADIGQLLLQNDIFVALGATIIASLPVIAPYWLPVIHPASAPKQFQFSSAGAVIATTVTRTATIFPKPKTLTDKVYETIVQTQTATHTFRVTSTVPKTIYDTVTEQVTSVSTFIDRHYLTKWTHYPVDPATPCTTITYTPDVTMPSLVTATSEASPPDVTRLRAAMLATTSWFPWRALACIFLALLCASIAANLLMWFRDPRVIHLSTQVAVSQIAFDGIKRSRDIITQNFLAERTILLDRCHKAERRAAMLSGKDAMLQELGVSEADDEETLTNKVKARADVLAVEKQRLDNLERENKAQAATTNDLEETIKMRLTNEYMPGVARSFDELLHDKRREINIQRNMISGGNVDETIKESARLHEKKDAELSELRFVRKEVMTLQQALTEAKNETARVEEQKKAKGVADERRWNEARNKLRKEQSAKISALKEEHSNQLAALESDLEQGPTLVKKLKAELANRETELLKMKRLSASFNKSQPPRSTDVLTINKLTKRIVLLEAELEETKQSLAAAEKVKQAESSDSLLIAERDRLVGNNDYLQRSLDQADAKCKGLEDNFKALAKQLRQVMDELKRLKDQKADDKQTCESEKNQLRRRIIELEKALEAAGRKHDSQSSAETNATATDLKFGAVETELRNKIASLSKDVHAKHAQEGALSTQVTTLTQQRDAAIREKVDTGKQLEDAKAKGEAVWSQLQKLKAASSTDQTAAATVAQYQVDVAQKDRKMQELEKNNSDLQTKNDQLRQQGNQEIESRDRQIQQLKTDAVTGNQTIYDLQQSLTKARATIESLQKRIDDVSAELVVKNSEIHKLNASVEDKNRVIRDQQTTTNTSFQTAQLEALKKELQAEKDKYILKVNDLKNDIDFAQRELEKEKEERRNDTKLRNEAEQNRLDDLRSEMKQEIIMLKNSQEASTINRLQERVDFYEKENADLQDSGKEGWKNLLKRRDQKLREKEAELVKANNNVRHWHKLYNLFHRRWEILERNQDFKLDKATYEEAKESLFMGKDHDLISAMEKLVKQIEDLEAAVGRLTEERDALLKYADKAVEEEMGVDEDEDGDGDEDE